MGLKPERFTYKEFDKTIDTLASNFLEMGIKKDDIVIIQLPNIAEHVIAAFALWRIGAMSSHVIVQFRTHELSHILKLTEATAFITPINFHGFDHLDMAKRLQSEFPHLKHIISIPDLREMMFSGSIEEGRLNEIKNDANEIISITWTSGTEAEPKGCPRSHNSFIGMGKLCGSAAQMTPDDVILCPFPLQYLSSTSVFTTPVFLVGGTYILHHPFDMETFFQQLQDEKVTYSGGSPAMHLMMLNNPNIDKYDLSSLRLMMTGSAPAPGYVVKTYKEKYGVEMINFWGQNEATGFPSGPLDVPDPYLRVLTFPQFGKKGVTWHTFGTEYIETKIIDPDTDEEVTEVGKIGELIYKCPFTIPCYFKNPVMTAKSWKGEFFRTGDFFRIEKDNLLTFYTRKKDIIIRGGQNISPEEIEDILQYHPKVLEVAVVGYPDPRLGEKTCACIVPKQGETITLEEVVNFVKEKDVAVFKLPQRLEVMDHLPRNPAQKVQKAVLRANIKEKLREEGVKVD